MHQLDIINYYSRKDVQSAIADAAKDREIAGTVRDGAFMARPDVLQYPKDVIEKVKNGAVAFHLSVEHWKQPLSLATAMGRKDLDELRKGWDMIIDIDAKAKLEHAKEATVAVVDFLKELGVNPTVKFSGRRGFHIGIAGNAFPAKVDFKPLAQQYPEIPQALAGFIKESVKERIMESLIRAEGGVAALAKTVEKMSALSPYEFIEIEKDWGSRHMFRAPYSLHNKTWLVSVPVPLFKIRSFDPDSAKPEKVKTAAKFLANRDCEAQELLLRALDWASKLKKREEKAKEPKTRMKSPIPEEHFPPCIRDILGMRLKDGRKRSVFTLISFLRAANWDWNRIEQRMEEWNKAAGLPNRFVSTQIKWHARQKRELMPPNCGSELFYKSLGICKNDCGKVKNPVNYAFKSYGRARRKG
ncbi:MAG: hypothetical protein QXU82_00335 [Candidatus Aenigmatarchaeota archaeon]